MCCNARPHVLLFLLSTWAICLVGSELHVVGAKLNFSTHLISRVFCLPSTANSGQPGSDHRLPLLRESLLWCYIKARIGKGGMWERERDCQTEWLGLEGTSQAGDCVRTATAAAVISHQSFFHLVCKSFPSWWSSFLIPNLCWTWTRGLSKILISSVSSNCEPKKEYRHPLSSWLNLYCNSACCEGWRWSRFFEYD